MNKNKNKKMESNQPNPDFFDDVNDENNINIENNEKIENTEGVNNNSNNNKNSPNQYLILQELKEFMNPSSKLEDNSSEVSLENIDEDLYMEELYLRLSQMKQERKKAEENAKLLDNRLNLLKVEEIKALKKIELTKKKANDKLQNLQFMVKNKNMKNEAKKKKLQDLTLKKEQNKLMSQTIKKNTQINKDKLKRQINEEAQLLKIQKIYNKQLVNFLNEEKINQNKAKCANIKNEQNLFSEKRRMLILEKKRKLREELEKKLINEYKLKEDAENKKIKAEQQEIQIIQKLQNTTKLQQNIKEEYDKMNIKTVMRGDYESYNNNSNKNRYKLCSNKKTKNKKGNNGIK